MSTNSVATGKKNSSKSNSAKANDKRKKAAKAGTKAVEQQAGGEAPGTMIDEQVNTENTEHQAQLTDTQADVDVVKMLAEGTIIPCSYVSMERIIPCPYNVRKNFDDAKLTELSESIKIHGVMQPIQLRPIEQGKYQIVFGERRFRAAQLLGLTVIPAQIRESSEEQSIEMCLTENLQRDDITDFEWGEYFKWLIDQKRYTVKGLVDRCNKSEHFIRTRLRLTELIPELVALLNDDDISINLAMELCKYEKGQQQEVYEAHFKDPYIDSWRNLKPGQLAKSLVNLYMTRLDSFNFDKSDCNSCFSNSGFGVLFPECADCSVCKNLQCLHRKNAAYLTQGIKAMLNADDKVERAVLLSDNLPVGNELSRLLDEEGIEYHENESCLCYDGTPDWKTR